MSTLWKLVISFVLASFVGGALGASVNLGVAGSLNTGLWVLILWVAFYYILGTVYKKKPTK